MILHGLFGMTDDKLMNRGKKSLGSELRQAEVANMYIWHISVDKCMANILYLIFIKDFEVFNAKPER